MRQYFHKGMTLVEMLVVIALFTIILLVITNSVDLLYKLNAYTYAQANEIESVRRGMYSWNRDAREMITAEDGTFPVSVIDEYTFGYYSDTDQDDSVEYVEYVLATTTLTKYTYSATGYPATYSATPDNEEVLSEYVQNIVQNVPLFTYYDNDGTQLASTSPLVDVRYISAQIIVNIDPVRDPGEFMLRSSVAPRNLKDNL